MVNSGHIVSLQANLEGANDSVLVVLAVRR